MTALNIDMRELNLDEIDFVSGAGYSAREYAEAALVGMAAGALISGGNPAVALAGGAIAIAILHL